MIIQLQHITKTYAREAIFLYKNVLQFLGKQHENDQQRMIAKTAFFKIQWTKAEHFNMTVALTVTI